MKLLNWEERDEELELLNQDALYYGPTPSEETSEEEQSDEGESEEQA